MPEQSEKTIKLAAVTNFTDQKVIFDPTYKKSVVAKTWLTNDPNEPDAIVDTGLPKPNGDQTRIDGIEYPIILIDHQTIPQEYIKSFKLSSLGFKPQLELTIMRYDEMILNTTGMANKITVVILPPDDGTYKKISLDFYIDNKIELTNNVKYICSFLFPKLELKHTKSIKLDSNNKLNTYQLLESIAKQCQLGFASTDYCKDVADTKIRLSRNQNYFELIEEHLSFSGLDYNSMFNSWIDVYGYIVLNNVAWIFNQIVNPNQLSMKMLKGINMVNPLVAEKNNIKYETEDTFRTFTNWRMQGEKNNNVIEKYEWVVDNFQIKLNGTENNYYILNHLVNGTGGNDIVTESTYINEDSDDGKNLKNLYTFQINKFIGTEMGNPKDGNTPILLQKYRRNTFFSKLNAKKLKVTLKEISFAIERGMLININVFEYEQTKKRQILLNTPNLSEGGNKDFENTQYPEEQIDQIITTTNFGVFNYEVSGIYYIDGIDYVYKAGESIKQILYLIKHTGATNSYLNYSSLPKFKNTDLKQNETI